MPSRILSEEWVDLDRLTPYPGNPRRGNVKAIAESLAVNGQYRSIVVQKSTGYVLAGNHTRAGAQMLAEALAEVPATSSTAEAAALLGEKLGLSEPVARDLWASRADNDGWTKIRVGWIECDDQEARRIVLADNRTADLGTYDNQALADLLGELDGDFEGTAYTPQAVGDLVDLLGGIEPGADDDLPAGHSDGEGGAPVDDESKLPSSDGSLLALADISVAEPDHDVSTGDAWELGGTHVLLCVDVMEGWESWSKHLQPGDLFVPYPGPFAALTTKAGKRRLVMVQPDPYLAGHVLDKYAAVRGADKTKRIDL